MSNAKTDKSVVSIVVPVYNAESNLDQCIRSLLAQSHAEIEIILVDDGSTDGSAALCSEFALEDMRVHYVFQSNSGVSAARNRGMAEATGDYLMFVDSDDWLVADAVERALGIAVSKKARVVMFDHSLAASTGEIIRRAYNFGGLSGKVKGDDLRRRCLDVGADKMLTTCWMLFLDRSLVDDNNGIKFDARINMMEDLVFVYELLGQTKWAFILQEDLYRWRQFRESASHGYIPTLHEDVRTVKSRLRSLGATETELEPWTLAMCSREVLSVCRSPENMRQACRALVNLKKECASELSQAMKNRNKIAKNEYLIVRLLETAPRMTAVALRAALAFKGGSDD